MFAFTVFTGIMVLVGTMLGVGEIIRDLILDHQMLVHYMDYDYIWDRALEGPFNVPPEMFFFRDCEDMDFVVEVDDEVGQFLYFGYNPDDIKDLLEVSEMLSDEGTKPLFIDIRGPMIEEIRNEFRAQNYDQRGKLVNLTKCEINAY